MSTPIKTWRYYLPTIDGLEGWAEIVICSSGLFAAVSDYGNYAFAWRHTGCNDVREFFLRAPRDWDYFAHKLGGQHWEEYDGEKSERLIKETILRRRRECGMTRDEARREWNLLEECDHLYGQHEFSRWYERTKLDDAQEYYCKSIQASLRCFCQKTMARLAEVIRAELEAEASNGQG